MPKKTYVKKDNPMLVQLMMIVALAAVIIFIMTLKSTMPAQTPTLVPTPSPIEFDGTTTELNSVDIDQLDAGLNQLNTETSTF